MQQGVTSSIIFLQLQWLSPFSYIFVCVHMLGCTKSIPCPSLFRVFVRLFLCLFVVGVEYLCQWSKLNWLKKNYCNPVKIMFEITEPYTLLLMLYYNFTENPCKGFPCGINGTCVPDGATSKCDCLPGYVEWDRTCKGKIKLVKV